MRMALWLLAVLAGTFVTTSHAPAQAQLLHTWVASNGNDNANCNQPTPCATFQGAFDKTRAGGEITCVDRGRYGGLSIAKSITVNCEAATGSTTSTGGTSPGTISVSGLAAADVVILRGLDLEGADGTANGALIVFNTTGTLRLEKMKVMGLHGPSHGVQFTPTGTAKLHVSDSIIANNGTGSGVFAGINIQPASGGQATVMVERCRIDNNLFGIFAFSPGPIRGVVKDSVVSNNTQYGIIVDTGTNAGLLVDNTLVSGSKVGLAVSGFKGLMLVRRSTITSNNEGLLASGGGTLVSYQDNTLTNNSSDGAFTSTIGTQ